MAITEQFLLGCMVNAVPSSARGCRKADLICLALGPLACPQGGASLPVPKQALDSPNTLNRNSTSVGTSTTYGSLTGSLWRRLSCSRCRKPWTSVVFVACVFTIPVCMIALYDRKPRLGHNVKIHKMHVYVTCVTSKCKPIRFNFFL